MNISGNMEELEFPSTKAKGSHTKEAEASS